MIAWLRGVLISKNPDAVVLDVEGVGYLLSLSLNSFCQLPPVGGKVSIEVHTYVREDQISLFGFLVPGEREAFRHLMSIAGIGPRLALNILSGVTPAELAEAVSTGNLKRLQSAPGVGKKTAERILIELKDKLRAPALQDWTGVAKPVAPASLTDDLVLALTTLGYKKIEIDRVLQQLKVDPGIGIEQLIREALKLLKR
jgi:Holliday junction DNA helicase RuvA